MNGILSGGTRSLLKVGPGFTILRYWSDMAFGKSRWTISGCCSSIHRYPVLVDAVIQSGAIGFVGTDRSTMSILARRRAETWHNAVSRTVKWGNPTADDH